MPVNVVTCPSCGVTLKPKTPIPEGARLKCPKCQTPFVVPGAPAAAAPKPAAPPSPKPRPAPADDIMEATEIIDDEGAGSAAVGPKKPIPVWVWLVAGGVGLFVLCGCCGGPATYFAMYGVPGFGGGNVTKANFDKIKKNMTEAQVKAILGEPTATTDLGGMKSDTWRGGGDDFITIGFQNDKAIIGGCQFTSGGVTSTHSGGLP